MPDLHTTFPSSGSMQFTCWLFSRWEEVQVSLSSEEQPCSLPEGDLEHCPRQLGRDESVCAFGQAQQNANRRQKQRTPWERCLPGGRGRARQVNQQQKPINSDLPMTYSRSLLDGWRLVSKV